MTNREISKPSVLVVDNEPGIRAALETLLSGDFEVYEAKDGSQALGILQETLVGAVLLDMQTPGMGGNETLLRIRQAGCFAPVMLMSASWPSGWACGSKGDVFGRISKPWNTEVVTAMVRLAVAYGESGAGAWDLWRLEPGDKLSVGMSFFREVRHAMETGGCAH